MCVGPKQLKIFKLGTNYGLICHFWDFRGLSFYISPDKFDSKIRCWQFGNIWTIIQDMLLSVSIEQHGVNPH